MLELNKIYNEDCLEGLKKIDDGSIDMILTDPPYGTLGLHWDVVIDPSKMFEQMLRIIKPNGAILLFSQLPFGVDLINACRKYYRYEWIWEKSLPVGYLNSKKMPLRTHENIFVFYKELPTYNPQKFYLTKYRKFKRISAMCYGKQSKGMILESRDGSRYPRDIITFDNNCFKNNLHATSKPIPLLAYLINTYTNENEVVLDACMGSGSTAVACKATGRQFIGFETDPEFYRISQERLAKIQPTLFDQEVK